jgi:hypothetical protein
VVAHLALLVFDVSHAVGVKDGVCIVCVAPFASLCIHVCPAFSAASTASSIAQSFTARIDLSLVTGAASIRPTANPTRRAFHAVDLATARAEHRRTGFRFRRRLRLFPGVRLNFSKSGVSTSIGRRGSWFTVGPR